MKQDNFKWVVLVAVVVAGALFVQMIRYDFQTIGIGQGAYYSIRVDRLTGGHCLVSGGFLEERLIETNQNQLKRC